MKNNKKGFTLIELLAVIVILAIIALIAVPVILNIINKANKSASKDTVYRIIEAGELYFADQELDITGMKANKEFEFPNNIDGLQIKGKLPNKGKMIVNTKGEIALAVSNGRYTVTKGFEESEVTITESKNNVLPGYLPEKVYNVGDSVYYNPETGSVCNDYTANNSKADVKKGCMKWYVYKKEGNTVTIVLDHNTTNQSTEKRNATWSLAKDASGNFTNAEGPTNIMKVLKEDISLWNGMVKANTDLIAFEDVVKLTPWYKEYIEANPNAKPGTYDFQYAYIINWYKAEAEYKKKYPEGTQGPGYNAFMKEHPVYKKILLPDYMHVGNNYWTKYPYAGSSRDAWYVHSHGFAYDSYVENTWVGARPVITLNI